MSEAQNKLRLFIAIALPDDARRALKVAQDELKAQLPGPTLRWTRPDQFHLTLKFLGDVEDSLVSELIRALRRGCLGFPQMQMHAEAVGVFPNLRRPRVIWAGVRDAADCLLMLQQGIELALESFNFGREDREFSGHITLARCQLLQAAEADELAAAVSAMAQRRLAQWTATHFELIRSELLPQGSSYTTLATIPLAAEAPFGTLPGA
jgi:RNA 2',3'-cyclic 3'-phosphodiesterase